MKLKIKSEFSEKYSKLTDYKEYEKFLFSYCPYSFRINTLKTSVKEVAKSFDKLKKIPWCNEGFWIETERRDLGNFYEHQLGYIYIQEAASMLPPVVLDAKKEDMVLDAAASPGSKTTQISAMMKNNGLIIANDISYHRMRALSHNLQRCGVLNAVTTISDALRISDKFDRILLDAPCSGVGTIRGETGNSMFTMETYSKHKVLTLAGVQRRLILKCYDNLRNNGIMVYSTCSLEPEENEGVVQYLLDNTDAKLVKTGVNVKSEVNYEDYSSELKNCIKLWPQFYNTEGFFVAKIKRP